MWWSLGKNQEWISHRLNNDANFIANESKNFNPRRSECFLQPGMGFKSPLCRFGHGDDKIVVLGDSHANATVSAIASISNGSTIEITSSGCATVFGLKRIIPGTQCPEFNKQSIDLINKKYPHQAVVIINRSSLAYLGANEIEIMKPEGYFDKPVDMPNEDLNRRFSEQYVKTVCSIKNPSRVYLLRPYPEMNVDVPKSMSRTLLFYGKIHRVSTTINAYMQRNKIAWDAQDEAKKSCGVNILNPIPYLCNADICWGDRNGRPLYYDFGHLSEYGNKLLIPMFRKMEVPN